VHHHHVDVAVSFPGPARVLAEYTTVPDLTFSEMDFLTHSVRNPPIVSDRLTEANAYQKYREKDNRVQKEVSDYFHSVRLPFIELSGSGRRFFNSDLDNEPYILPSEYGHIKHLHVHDQSGNKAQQRLSAHQVDMCEKTTAQSSPQPGKKLGNSRAYSHTNDRLDDKSGNGTTLVTWSDSDYSLDPTRKIEYRLKYPSQSPMPESVRKLLHKTGIFHGTRLSNGRDNIHGRHDRKSCPRKSDHKSPNIPQDTSPKGDKNVAQADDISRKQNETRISSMVLSKQSEDTCMVERACGVNDTRASVCEQNPQCAPAPHQNQDLHSPEARRHLDRIEKPIEKAIDKNTVNIMGDITPTSRARLASEARIKRPPTRTTQVAMQVASYDSAIFNAATIIKHGSLKAIVPIVDSTPILQAVLSEPIKVHSGAQAEQVTRPGHTSSTSGQPQAPISLSVISLSPDNFQASENEEILKDQQLSGPGKIDRGQSPGLISYPDVTQNGNSENMSQQPCYGIGQVTHEPLPTRGSWIPYVHRDTEMPQGSLLPAIPLYHTSYASQTVLGSSGAPIEHLFKIQTRNSYPERILDEEELSYGLAETERLCDLRDGYDSTEYPYERGQIGQDVSISNQPWLPVADNYTDTEYPYNPNRYQPAFTGPASRLVSRQSVMDYAQHPIQQTNFDVGHASQESERFAEGIAPVPGFWKPHRHY
jgi:hypothetical protein